MTAEFRDKSDRFVYTKLGQKIGPNEIMDYLGKKIPVCYLTDATVDVILGPLDLNVENLLPSNMSYVSKRFFTGDPLTMIVNFTTVRQNISENLSIDLVFLAPHFATKKITAHAKELINKYKEIITKAEFNSELAYVVWDQFMFEGLKGMFEVKVSQTDSEGTTTIFGIEAQLAWHYLTQKTAVRMKAIAGLQL